VVHVRTRTAVVPFLITRPRARSVAGFEAGKFAGHRGEERLKDREIQIRDDSQRGHAPHDDNVSLFQTRK
jgi:hypothetical protein